MISESTRSHWTRRYGVRYDQRDRGVLLGQARVDPSALKSPLERLATLLTQRDRETRVPR